MIKPRITYKIASTRDELEQAYHLVHTEYVARGYYAPQAHGLKLSLHNALPTTTTLVATCAKKVIGTVSIINDSPLGLPMETIYPDEIAALRNQHRKIAEISMLAVNTDLFGKSVFLMLNSRKLLFVFRLFKFLYDYVRFTADRTDLCITHHPRHSLLYKFLAFEKIGKEKTYPWANGKPAIGQRLDLITVAEKVRHERQRGLERLFLMRDIDQKRLIKKYFLSPNDLAYFFLKKTDLFKNLSYSELDCFKHAYPTYDFDVIFNRHHVALPHQII